MTWLEEEERLIKMEMNGMNRSHSRNFDNKILLAVFLFTLLSLIPQISHIYSCPNKGACSNRKLLFPDVWICKQCGYDNYEGINTCAVCGTPKGTKKR